MKAIQLGKLEHFSYAKREALNSLRTNVLFCGADIKVILFTSATPDEGKSSTVMGLGQAFAEDGKKTLIIDADLRKSVLAGRHHARTDKGAIIGMSHYLTGQAQLQDVLYRTNVDNLDMVFAGRNIPNPTELLGNDYFAKLLSIAKEYYDVVLIDAPPLGSVIDAAIIAPQCDGAILLIESKKNSYRHLQEIKKQLEVTGVRILGTILNKVQMDEGGYYNRYYQEYYKEYAGTKGNE